MKRTKLDHAALAAAHDAGDWDTLMDAGLSWVRFALTKLQRRGVVHIDGIDEDLYQEGAIALWRAVQSWDPLSYKFSSHIIKYIEGAIMNYSLREAMQGIGSDWSATQHGVQTSAMSLNGPVERDGGNPEQQDTLQDKLDYRDVGTLIPSGLDLPENEIARAMTDWVVDQLMAELPSEDAALMRAVYQTDKTIQDYANVSGIPRRTLNHRVEKLRRQLAERLESSVISDTGCRDWKGVKQHYPAPPSFWSSTAGPSTTVLADMPGRSYWSEKSGRVHGDWSWKPQPQDIPPTRKRKVAA